MFDNKEEAMNIVHLETIEIHKEKNSCPNHKKKKKNNNNNKKPTTKQTTRPALV